MIDADALKKASDAAVEMRETSKGWVAKRGRQSFTGDRSIGTYDPGTVAIGDMAKAIVEALKKARPDILLTTDVIVGFRNTELFILVDELERACSKLMVMTDDGSNGHKGFTTTALEAQIQAGGNGSRARAQLQPEPLAEQEDNDQQDRDRGHRPANRQHSFDKFFDKFSHS